MQEIHLLVGVNGMWGNPGHLAHLASVISAQFEDAESTTGGCQLEVFLAQNNRHTSTYDGIDWGGERVADEVITKIREIEEDGTRQVVKFSAVGYSLGGLVARYLVGIMSSRNLFVPAGRIKPMNFTTFATPHIGIPVYPTFFSSLGPHLAPKLLSRTGEQFFGRDRWSETGRPLLEVMADKNRIFWKTLASFEKVVFYANAVNDRTVPYVTGGIDTHDPFMAHETNGIHIEIDEDYPPLIKSFTVTDTPPPPPPVPPLMSVARVQSWMPKPVPLPPFLKYRFPLNLVVYAMIPLLLPVFLPLVVGRFAIDSRASRQRIKLLEKNEEGTLVSMWTQLEKDMDDVVADIIDDPGRERDGMMGEDGMVAGAVIDNPAQLPSGGQPTLTPAQKRMVKNLNELPGLVKRLAFLHPMVNSHGTIIVRDLKRFAFHKLGEGVLRHWADGFVL